MLRTPPHLATSEPTADRTDQLLAAVRVVAAALTALTALCAAGLARQVHWQRPGLATGPSSSREATP
jgi:hypothetical protein